MEESYQSPEQQYFFDINTRIRDIEEKQRLLKDRILLIGKNFVDDRESMFEDLQELKKLVMKITEENIKMKDFIQRISDMLSETARKEELMILQRQIDILTKSGHKK